MWSGWLDGDLKHCPLCLETYSSWALFLSLLWDRPIYIYEWNTVVWYNMNSTILSKYLELIHFGPVIRLWTLRFSIFQAVCQKITQLQKYLQNSGQRHQFLQAYLSAGNLFPPAIQVEKGTEFYVASYTFESQSAVACNNVTVKERHGRRL